MDTVIHICYVAGGLAILFLVLVGMMSFCSTIREIVEDSQFPTDHQINTATNSQIVTWAHAMPPAETKYQVDQTGKIIQRYLELPEGKQMAEKLHLKMGDSSPITCPNCGRIHPLVAEFGYCGSCATQIYSENPSY